MYRVCTRESKGNAISSGKSPTMMLKKMTELMYNFMHQTVKKKKPAPTFSFGFEVGGAGLGLIP